MLSLGEAIRAAHCESLQAEQRRNDLLARAREEGVTIADLGHLLGVDAVTAWRWSGGKTGRKVRDLGNSLALLGVPVTCDGIIHVTEIGGSEVGASSRRGTEPQGGPAHG